MRSLSLPLLVIAAGPLLAQSSPPQPTVVAEAASLPPLTYRLPASPSRMIGNAAQMTALANEVERNSRRLLEGYDIRDASTRRDLLAARRVAAFVRGDVAAALAFDRAASSVGAAGLATELLVAALQSRPHPRGRRDSAAIRSALRATLNRRGGEARGAIVALRRDLALASSAYRIGELTAFADPEWQRNPSVNQDFAIGLLRFWTEINLRNPLLDDFEAELVHWLRRHPDTATDIWPAREMDIASATAAPPVTIAVWDGVDPDVFAGQLAADSGEQVNGRDDDGDGFVDEAEGLAFDEHYAPVSGTLLPVPTGLQRTLPDYERYARGVGDLAAGLDSPDVAFARAWRRRLTSADVEAFERGYRFYANFAHGTRVAGVALRGLPRARLVPVRITFADRSPPLLADEAAARGFVAMVTTATRYMRARGVRLCNISWGVTPQDIEYSLAQNGAEPDPEARGRRAQRIFDIMLDGMTRAIASAPDILFVVSAGNASQDIDFVRDLPGSINLPNVLTVGAADGEGRAASFASTGPSVDIYARGTDVESVVPGGGRHRGSGASLAAPQVINAAARLLMLDPSLAPPQLARLLIETASPVPGSSLPLLNARAAGARLLAQGRR